MTRRRHLLQQAVVAAAILLLLLAGTAVLVVRSGWFRELVRQRIVSEIEAATGGRVELGNFSFKWETLVAKISPLVLHGKEPASDTPFLRVESATLGLRIISMLERKVDLASLRVEQPRVNIVIYPDGSDNIPSPPGSRAGKSWAQNLVDLAIRRYQVTDGLVEIDLRKIPLEIQGEDLRLRMDFDARARRYRGEMASHHLRIATTVLPPLDFDSSASFSVDAGRLSLFPLRLTTGQSVLELDGSLTDLRAPQGTLKGRAVMSMRDAVPLFSLPLAPAGSANFDGDLAFTFAGGFDYSVTGRLAGRGLAYTRDRLRIENATAAAAVRLTPQQLTLRGIEASALGANLTGSGELKLVRSKDFHFEGAFEGLTVREAASVLTPRPVPWNGAISGTLALDAVWGEARAKVHTAAIITPAADGSPLEGKLDVIYDQRAGTVSFGDSRFTTPASSLLLSGTLGQTLDIRARSTNLDELLPVVAMLGSGAAPRWPVQLKAQQGDAAVAGLVSGPLDDPQFRGQVTLTNAIVEGHGFDRFLSDVQASRQGVTLRGLSLSRGSTQIAGDASIAASNGSFTEGTLAAQLSVKNLRVADTAREFGVTLAGDALAAATVHLSGTARRPEAEIAFDAVQATGLGEKIDRLRANLRYTPLLLAFSAGQAEIGSGRVLFSGSFTHPEGDFRNGDLTADITAQAITASRIAALHGWEPGAEARLDGQASLQGHVNKAGFVLGSVRGEASARGIMLDKEKLGDVNLLAATAGNEVSLQGKAQVRGTTVEGQGKWRLEGDYPGSGAFRFSRLTAATLRDLALLRGNPAEKAAPLPFEGFVEGGGTITVALRKLQEFRADLEIDTLQLNPRPQRALQLDVQAQDIQIRNTQPILLTLSAKEARLSSAHFTARDTNLEASGMVPFSGTGGADLAIQGNVNLAVLQLLNPDLLARGTASVNATVRGSLRDPQMNGRMQFNNASLYMNDVPNGVDNATGSILFDRNRATIESLTADTGGGKIALRGFVEFGGTLLYRLQAEARQVRVRYPEDVSFTSNAQLSLNGTSEASTLSGTVTLNRAAVSPGADLAKLLAQAGKPSPAPPNPNEYLRGMRFDVHIENAPLFELETSLTRNVQTEVDLRLRGTPLRPALLGTITVDSGEVQVFGNRYTVNRGDIRFLNSVKIEPTFDLDLETHTRGIIVNVTVAGSPERLSVNYSSDPPLQSREIIALLAVGRDPTSTVAGGQISSSSTPFGNAGGLLGEAVSQQLSNRLQRFFGASRVKIDPTLSGVENLPAARLTLEQQISRDISLTYITNLNRTQEQIVRIQWDFNRQWSAVAVRNSNGLFGIDVQYRKRF